MVIVVLFCYLHGHCRLVLSSSWSLFSAVYITNIRLFSLICHTYPKLFPSGSLPLLFMVIILCSWLLMLLPCLITIVARPCCPLQLVLLTIITFALSRYRPSFPMFGFVSLEDITSCQITWVFFFTDWGNLEKNPTASFMVEQVLFPQVYARLHYSDKLLFVCLFVFLPLHHGKGH